MDNIDDPNQTNLQLCKITCQFEAKYNHILSAL